MASKKYSRKPSHKDAPEWAKAIAMCDYNDPTTNHRKGQWCFMGGVGKNIPGYFIHYEKLKET